jgi:hypothetical protein
VARNSIRYSGRVRAEIAPLAPRFDRVDHVGHILRHFVLSIAVALLVSLFAQSQSTALAAATNGAISMAAAPSVPTGNVSGTVLDKDGAAIPNAAIVLTEGSFSLNSVSGGDGAFTLKDVPAGSFDLSVSANGFATLHQSGSLQPGQNDVIAPVQLVVATTVEVNVTHTREEIAEEQIRVAENQRILGVVPNYYVTYDSEAQPLNPRQKFQLGWKFVLNPFSFGIAGFVAGLEQANNSFSGYGQGAQGYAKRFGATYADFASGTFFGNVVFPIILKQDPRYFYKGTGTKKSRFFYAISMAVVCKGNNGHWQPNYSNVLGSLAAGGLSNVYYPAANRNGLGLTFENTLIGLGGSAMGAVVEEFFSKRLTPHARDTQPSH